MQIDFIFKFKEIYEIKNLEDIEQLDWLEYFGKENIPTQTNISIFFQNELIRKNFNDVLNTFDKFSIEQKTQWKKEHLNWFFQVENNSYSDIKALKV